MLHVTERTLHNWITGRHAVPYSAFKLVRVMCRLDIPFPGWEGWTFCAGHLYSPEGHRFSGKDSSWWSLLVRQARMFSPLRQENAQLRQRIRTLEAASTPASLVPGFLEPVGVRNTVTPHFSLTSEIPAAPGFVTTEDRDVHVTRPFSPLQRNLHEKSNSFGPSTDQPASRKNAPRHAPPKVRTVSSKAHAATGPNPTARDRLARFLPRGAR